MEIDRIKLKMLRLAKGKAYTQKKIAEELNVSLGAYRNWEQGVNSPDFKTLQDIALYFAVPLED